MIEYTYVANTDYNNVLSTQLASGEGPDIIMDGTNYQMCIRDRIFSAASSNP